MVLNAAQEGIEIISSSIMDGTQFGSGKLKPQGMQ